MASEASPAPNNSGYVSVEHDGWIAESNTHSEEQLRAAMEAPTVDDAAKAAAATLGKRGADAKARKAKEPEKPAEKPEPEKAVPREAKAEKEKKAPAKEAKAEEDEDVEAKADEDEDEEPEPVKAKEDEREKRKRDARERVLEATREAAELKRQNRRLEQELAQAKAAPKPAEAKAEPAPKGDSDDPEPVTAGEGEDEVAFLERKSRWWARQEFKTLRAKDDERRRAEEVERYVNERSDVVKAAITKAGGEKFLGEMSDEVLLLEPSHHVLMRGERPDALNALADEVLRSGDDAPRLMRYLTEHPEVIQRLSSPTLRPSEFTREMGRIEARLEAATAGPSAPKPSSQAPKPARPVAGLPTNADAEPDPRNSSYDEHAVFYNARERRRTA